MHTGWHSHKYKKDTKHCIDVLVLVENGNNGYFIAASFMSPEFEIVSTKTVQKKVNLIEIADDGMSQALRLAQKDIGPQSSSAVLAELAKVKKESLRNERQSSRVSKRMKLLKEQESFQQQQEEEAEAGGEEEEEMQSSPEEGTVARQKTAAHMLPEMFASLINEEIVEL
jgi:hypothetical protein